MKHITFRVRWSRTDGSYGRSYLTAGVVDWPAIYDGSMRLHHGRQKVVRRPIIVLELDYPLDEAYHFTFIKLTGFTRRDLLRCVYRAYSKIYKDVRQYGVWGHHIGDLIVDSLSQANKENKMLYKAEIGS